MKTKPKKNLGGRPSRSERSARALANVDVTGCDPKSILQQIAADPSAPASARVVAAKALLALADKPDEADDDRVDDLTMRALCLTAGGRQGGRQ